MNILALDLGTSTGAAGSWGSETWLLATESNLVRARKLRLDRRLDIRAVALWMRLSAKHKETPLDWIVFEDVQFAKSRLQVQLWSAFRGVVWAFATGHGIQVDCLHTNGLKEFATGNGGADKPMMGRGLAAKHPDVYELENGLVKRRETGIFLSDDEVDALHLFDWASQNLK